MQSQFLNIYGSLFCAFSPRHGPLDTVQCADHDVGSVLAVFVWQPLPPWRESSRALERESPVNTTE
jgi:hypothetical protein